MELSGGYRATYECQCLHHSVQWDTDNDCGIIAHALIKVSCTCGKACVECL